MKKITFLLSAALLLIFSAQAQPSSQTIDTALHIYTFWTGSIVSFDSRIINPKPVWQWKIQDTVIMRRSLKAALQHLPFDTIVVASCAVKEPITPQIWTIHYKTDNHGFTYDLFFILLDGSVMINGVTRLPYFGLSSEIKIFHASRRPPPGLSGEVNFFPISY